jgi:hypothetical protein
METCSLTRADYRSEASRGKGEPFFPIRHAISSVQSFTSLAIALTRTNAFAAICAVPELHLPHEPLSCDMNPVPFDYQLPFESLDPRGSKMADEEQATQGLVKEILRSQHYGPGKAIQDHRGH